MSLSPNPHRAALVDQAVEILNRYREFSSVYQVTFSLGEPDAAGLPRIAARLDRPDGVPMAQGKTPLDEKLSHLKDQTEVVRPFYLPMMAREWEESDANEFSALDFDFAAILGYDRDPAGGLEVRDLFFLPTDALITRQRPREDGTWRVPLGIHNASRLSLEPRKKFARFLYLAERMAEGLEYQYDRYGYFYSTR